MPGSSDYPNAVDTYEHTDQPPDDLVGPHTLDHAAGIKAIQTELGTNPAGDAPTVRERMESVESGGVVCAAPTGVEATDRAAIEAAIATAVAAGLRRVILGVGTYLTDQEIELPSGITIQGQGHSTIVKRTGATAGKVFVNDDIVDGNTDITLRDLTVDRTEGDDALSTTADNAINFKYVSRLRIENVRARGAMKAIHLQSCSGWLVNPHCDSFRDNGIAINDQTGVGEASADDQVMHVLNPKLRQTAATKAAAGSSPIIITQSNTLVIEPDIESTVALAGYGVEFANPTTDAHDMRVVGGTLRGCGILLGNGDRQSIHDVTLEDGAVAESARIVVVPTGVGAAITNPSIKRNTIDGDAASPNGNLRVQSTTGGEVTDNRLFGTAYIHDDSTNTNVTFARNSQEAATVYASQEHMAQPGIVTPQSQISAALANSTDLVAQQKYVNRFVPEKDITAAGIAFRVATAAGADDGCDVGIYDEDFNLIASKGTTTGQLNGTGTKYLTFATPVALKAGRVYFAAFTTGTFGGTAARLWMYNFSSGGTSLLFAASGVNVDTGAESDASPLAATMTAPSGASQAPLLAVRES